MASRPRSRSSSADPLARLEAVEAVQFGGIVFAGIVDFAVGSEDVGDRQVVALADLVVGLVVRGRDLEHAGAEALLHGVVADDGDGLAMQRAPDLAADEVRPFPARFHRQRGVGHDGLGTGGGDGEVAAFRQTLTSGQRTLAGDISSINVRRPEVDGYRRAATRGGRFLCALRRHPAEGARNGRERVDYAGRFADQFIAHIIERAFLLRRDDLLVRDGSQRTGAPVDHARAAIDVAFVVQLDEDLLHGAGVGGVEGEAFARPVARGADLAQLLCDDAAELVLPLPNPLDETIAPKVVARFLFVLAQVLFHRRLRGEAGVVGAGQPEHFAAVHPRLAGENVLNGVVEHVAERQLAGDVRRRHDDGIGRLRRLRIGDKNAALLPLLVEAVFDLLGDVGGGEFGHGGNQGKRSYNKRARER